MDKFVLLNGYVKLNNEKLFYEQIKDDNFKEINILGILIMLYVMYSNIKEGEFLYSLVDYIGLVVIIFLIYKLYVVLFLKKGKGKLMINEIEQVEVLDDDDDELHYSVVLSFSDRRKRSFCFRKFENQLDPFLSALKKRNSRIVVNKS